MNEESVDPYEIELERAMAHQEELDRLEQEERMREERAEGVIEEDVVEEPIILRNSNGADINQPPNQISNIRGNFVVNQNSPSDPNNITITQAAPNSNYDHDQQQRVENFISPQPVQSEAIFNEQALAERVRQLRQEPVTEQEAFRRPDPVTQEQVNQSIFGEDAIDEMPPTPQVDAAVSEKKVVKVKKGEEKFHDKILRIAKSTLGEENASIERNTMNGQADRLAILLKWDFINMFNRHDNKHDIKDMYVALPITQSSFSDTIHGFRGKLSSAEHRSGYAHSHLWSGQFGINPFCTGSDGINDLWADLKMSNMRDEDFEIKWEGFIHQMEAFISYESIEGTPYIRFNNISSGSTRGMTSSAISNDCNLIFENIKASDIDLAMDFNSATVQLIETEHLHNIMAMYASRHQKRLENGAYVELDANQRSSEQEQWLSGSPFNFNGRQKVYVEPFHIENNNGKTERKYAHIRIVDEVKRRVELKGRIVLQTFCLENSVSIKDEEEGPDHYWETVNLGDLVPAGTETVERVVGPIVLETE